MQETWVQSLGGEDPLEKEMAIHSSILVWRIPWTEEPGGLWSVRLQKHRTRLSDEAATSPARGPGHRSDCWASPLWEKLSPVSWAGGTEGLRGAGQGPQFMWIRSFRKGSYLDTWAPSTAAHQASLSITNSRSLLKFIQSVMPSNHLILCRPLLLLPSIFPSIRVFSTESALPVSGQSIGASASASIFPMNIQT